MLRLNGKNDFELIETQTPMEDTICLLNEKIGNKFRDKSFLTIEVAFYLNFYPLYH